MSSSGALRLEEGSFAGLSFTRTLFNAYHHFNPQDARRILASSVDAGQCIVIFELSERRLLNILSLIPIFIMVLLIIPFLRPFRWSWLLFTYVLPIILLTIAWDGVVSHLRAYSGEELRSLPPEYSSGYEWEVIRRQIRKIPLTGLIGMPKPIAMNPDSCRQNDRTADKVKVGGDQISENLWQTVSHPIERAPLPMSRRSFAPIFS